MFNMLKAMEKTINGSILLFHQSKFIAKNKLLKKHLNAGKKFHKKLNTTFLAISRPHGDRFGRNRRVALASLGEAKKNIPLFSFTR